MLEQQLEAARAEATYFKRAFREMEAAYLTVQGAFQQTQVALQQTQVALQQTQVALQQTQAALDPNGVAANKPEASIPPDFVPVVELIAVEASGPPHISIDRETVLAEKPISALLAESGPAQCIFVPEIYFDVKQHPLSRLSTDAEEQYTYSNHSVRAPEMTLERLQDHYWFPESGFLVSKEGKVWRHSVLGQFSDPNFLTTYAIQDRQNSDGTVDYIFHESLLRDAPVVEGLHLITSHYASHNYGHYLLDMVPLIKVARDLGLSTLCKPLLEWQRAIYARVGLDSSQVREIKERVVFLKDAIVSLRHNAVSTYATSPNHRIVFEDILARVPGSAGNQDTRKRLFLSRGVNKNRDLRNRTALADALVERGFSVVRPETLSFDQQALLFANADVIVSEFGAIMANTVFCKRGTKVIEIIPEGQRDPWSAHMCGALEIEHVVLFHAVADADREPIDIGGRSLNNIYFKYDADIELVETVLDRLCAELMV